jgi:hypothetical protein
LSTIKPPLHVSESGSFITANKDQNLMKRVHFVMMRWMIRQR